MPGGDHTGPLGQGPQTGRAAGYCAGYDMPGYMNPIPGRGYWGWGRGRGSGWGGGGCGWRHWFHATGLTGWQRAALGWWRPDPVPFDAPPITRERELAWLQASLRRLEAMAQDLRRRISDLQAGPTEKNATQAT